MTRLAGIISLIGFAMSLNGLIGAAPTDKLGMALPDQDVSSTYQAGMDSTTKSNPDRPEIPLKWDEADEGGVEDEYMILCGDAGDIELHEAGVAAEQNIERHCRRASAGGGGRGGGGSSSGGKSSSSSSSSSKSGSSGAGTAAGAGAGAGAAGTVGRNRNNGNKSSDALPSIPSVIDVVGMKGPMLLASILCLGSMISLVC
ncbi:uncharacterized protein I206_100123 [Kwoniella pini CBS 10737]|uniref:Uncharacterized protein n=1 Tax=Kwoniella pini CBS 10737 TaxID=1296096 RepID=A0A1B9IEG9_9TREE|nr:uncharacterized protein I206_01204 [Kwoniella pini CBS 10737]OCF53897.1 hypothetical protein I206_01204 [Kwoniella pini CBS 10737]